MMLTNEQIARLAPATAALAPVDFVSKRYDFIPTLDAVDLLKETGWYPVHAEQGKCRQADRENFQRHCIRFSRTPDGVYDKKAERVDLMLYNSHDLGSSFKLAASVWRKVCGNGLLVASEFLNFTHRHINFDNDAFIESANLIAGSAGQLEDQMAQLKAIPLNHEEQLAFATAAHGLVYDDPAQAPVQPRQLLQARRYDDSGNDLWTTMNVVQENIIKGGLRGRAPFNPEDPYSRRRKVTTRPVQALDRNIKLNRALWSLTEKMAELKSTH